MTQTATETTTAPPVPVIVPETDSRLDQLLARLDAAKEAKATAEATEKEITEAIKAETAKLLPAGATSAILRSPHTALPWKWSVRETRRFDTTGFRKAYPQAWEQWAQPRTEVRLDAMK